MPAKVLESYSKRSGKSMEECEKAWEEAKKQANKKFPEDERDSDAYWRYVSIVTQMKLGIKTPKKKKGKKK